MKKRQALFTVCACNPRSGGKGGNRRISGANWPAVLARIDEIQVQGQTRSQGKRVEERDKAGRSISLARTAE